jgi:hypothetical protein
LSCVSWIITFVSWTTLHGREQGARRVAREPLAGGGQLVSCVPWTITCVSRADVNKDHTEWQISRWQVGVSSCLVCHGPSLVCHARTCTRTTPSGKSVAGRWESASVLCVMDHHLCVTRGREQGQHRVANQPLAGGSQLVYCVPWTITCVSRADVNKDHTEWQISRWQVGVSLCLVCHGPSLVFYGLHHCQESPAI